LASVQPLPNHPSLDVAKVSMATFAGYVRVIRRSGWRPDDRCDQDPPGWAVRDSNP
jgi:hypothetical protein